MYPSMTLSGRNCARPGNAVAEGQVSFRSNGTEGHSDETPTGPPL